MGTCVVAEIDLTIYEGGTFSQSFIWKTGDPATEVDLTGYSAEMMIRHRISDASPKLSITNKSGALAADDESGIYFTDVEDGEYTIYLNDADTAALCGSSHETVRGVYDLFLTSPSGEVVLKQYGTANLIGAVTR